MNMQIIKAGFKLIAWIILLPFSLFNYMLAYRQDYRCGAGFPAANGQDAECDPDGHTPCCSPSNWCGNTAYHCDCGGCTDYRPYRQDYRCGAGFPAAYGQDAECDPDGPYPCCSPWKWCGNTADHCDCDGCTDYRPYRQDSRCGAGFPAVYGEDAECNPDGHNPCCSPWHWCGNSADHCDCDGCTDYRLYRQDNRCGAGFPAAYGDDAECNPDGHNPCCSRWKWCGNTADHCDCDGCTDYRPYRQDYRCGAGFPAANGQDAECDPDGHTPCCSPSKWCGNTAYHCDCGGCTDYRPYRQDSRCGAGFPAVYGEDAECNPDGHNPCCSPWHWCGNSADHCDCDGCTDYRLYSWELMTNC
ncbi:uncharacterized protein [Apostichopus japonicus]|uniref:uncharacterized protein isoform X4 n=1 Tax=Stichopus japonicus TaxID=307972 RepID=UPI003AB1E1BD